MEFLQHLFAVAVDSATPLQALQSRLPPPPKGRTVVIGAGKAAAAMAQAVEQLWPADAALQGVVVTRYGHVPPRPEGLRQAIEVLEAAHPVPDEAGVVASQRIWQAVQGLGSDDLVLCLISGGGSALLSWPVPGLTLQDKQRIHQRLLDSGADIAQMNCVRKHLSRIKGGRLAQACHPAQLVTLAISDVPGDDASTIASGPTVADPSTCAQALEIVQRLGIALPPSVHAGLHSGALETPKPEALQGMRHHFALVATPMQALQAAARAAQQAGLRAYILGDSLQGESRTLAQAHAQQLLYTPAPWQRPCVLLSGGETTVTVDPALSDQARGIGGRSGEYVLALAQALQAQPHVWALAADTDGIDGSSSSAGAWIGPDCLSRAAAQGLDLPDALRRHDAHGFFQALGQLVEVGPTYTNVNDFRALMVLDKS